ncbi:MAG TPA: F0F1 ATP synthase subunit B [Candidatus Saccharimonadales bacterium]|nr:F0F1 ATP synthase subunit B [Candidatus Saccharimonadales bacterium]
MHDFIILAAATENPIQEISRTFGFNTHHFVAQVISFLLVAGLLYKFAYKKILDVLEERRQTIAQGLANAEKIKHELANAQAKAQEILTQANAQGNKLIEEARQSAARVSEAETQKAITTANEIIAKARLASEAELARMKAELRREIGRLVVATSAKVSGKILSPEDQQRLADETNRQLAA